MVLPVNTQQTYGTMGNREDLSDIIYNISPQDTPFFTMVGNNGATGTKHEWQTDEFDAPQDNAALEGDDASAQTAKPTIRLSNHTQIFTKSGSVSGTQEAVKSAGRKSEKAYQVMKKMIEIKKDIELAGIGNKIPSAGSSGAPRRLRGLAGWLKTNINAGAGWAAGTETTAMVPGTPRIFTETMLKDVIQKCYQSGGNPSKIMVAPSVKVLMTDTFIGSGSPVRTDRKASDKDAGSRVDVYYSDFGTLDVIPNRVMKNATSTLNNEDKVFIIDPKYWAFSTLRSLKRTDLAKTGDNEKFQLVTELTLEARNEASSGAVFDITA